MSRFDLCPGSVRIVSRLVGMLVLLTLVATMSVSAAPIGVLFAQDASSDEGSSSPHPLNLDPPHLHQTANASVATASTAAATFSSAVIDNGVVQLGVNPEAHLNVYTPDMPSDGFTFYTGLRFLPTNSESTAPGCLCEGWGAGDLLTGRSGYANIASDGVVNLSVVDFVSGLDASGSGFARSVVEVDDSLLRVTHDYHESITPFLYEATVTIENISSNTVQPVYRRVMDWDVEPTPFSEFVTIDTGTSTALLFSSDDGFASANPFGFRSSIAFTGSAVDSGPNDHGSLFDFGFPVLNPGESISFNIYYGAAPTELDALLAIDAVGAEVYSLGQPNTADGPTEGTPNTFIFAFSSVGGAPVERLQVRKKADSKRSEPGDENGYTIVINNPLDEIVTVQAINDLLPAGFSYKPGSTTGATTADPIVSGQSLTWSGPFAIPALGMITLHFNVNVASDQPAGIYYNNAGGAAEDADGNALDVRSTGNAAPVEVPPPTVATEPEATAGTGSVNTDPTTGKVTVSMPVGGRSDVTIIANVSCPAGSTLTSVTLLNGSNSYPMVENPAGSGQYQATIPAANVTDGPITIAVVCDSVPIVNEIGEIVLYDPSGVITDATTGLPIVGAKVTLYKVPGWLPDTVAETRDCRTVDTRGDSGWTQPAPTSLGVVADPDLDPAEIDPKINPQLTNSEGRYGWNVVLGCWYVVVEADGYISKTSPVVGVPPEVTDLDLALTPLGPELINSLLSLDNTSTSFSATPKVGAPSGVFRINFKFRNVSSEPLSDLHFEVTTLTNGNLLLNADGGPGGVGAILSIPPSSLGGDGILSPGETFTAVFDIGLKNRKTFTFFVSAYGIVNGGASVATVRNSDGFSLTVSPSQLQPGSTMLYLPSLDR